MSIFPYCGSVEQTEISTPIVSCSVLEAQILSISELAANILSRLPTLELLTFEAAAKRLAPLTEWVWKDRNGNHPDWGTCANTPFKEKWTFCLSEGLMVFLKGFVFFNSKDSALAQRFRTRFRGLMDRCAPLESYLNMELSSYEPPSQQIQKTGNAKPFAKAGWGGESLIQALIEIKSYKPGQIDRLGKIKTYARQAINKNSLVVGEIAFKLFKLSHSIFSRDVESLLEQITFMESAKGNFHNLHLLLNTYSLENINRLLNQGHMYPPIFEHKAKHLHITLDQTRLKEADVLLGIAIEKYDIHVPRSALGLGVSIKNALCKYVEAEKYFDQSILLYRQDDDPYPLLHLGAEIKFKLGKYAEADTLMKRILTLGGHKMGPRSFCLIAEIKNKLKNYTEAEVYIEKTIRMFNVNNIPDWVLAIAAETKFKLKKYLEAERLMDLALQRYGKNVPPFALAIAADIKSKQGKHFLAEKIIEVALKRYGEKATDYVLAVSAGIKFNLGKLIEAEQNIDKALEKYGPNLSKDKLKFAADIKRRLGKNEEADQLTTWLLS